VQLQESLRRIDEQIIGVNRPARNVFEVGPLTVMLDSTTDMIYANYALPTSSEVSDSEIADMVAVFQREGRTPRLEFRKEACPGLAERLEANGFTLEMDNPVMLCDRSTFVPVYADGVEVEVLAPDGDIEDYLRSGNEAFGMDFPINVERITKTREAIGRGSWVCAIGRIDGDIAGSAAITPFGGVGELAGVGTSPRFRRRGVASAVSSVLMERFFETNDLAWLSAGDDTARLVYERLGYRTVATQANYSRVT
jgi:GNAT superfamily N-acetyltransferase